MTLEGWRSSSWEAKETNPWPCQRQLKSDPFAAPSTADLYDDELDDVASALDALDDTRRDLP
jgi:hypothetical protein